MKKLTKISLLLVFTFVLSCSEDDNNVKNTSILTSKVWKRGMKDLNPSTNPPGNIIYYAVKNCEQDDTFKFDSNSLTINDNQNKCGEEEIKSVPYKIDRKKKEITINNQIYKIAEETKNQIKYYAPVPHSSGYDFEIFLLQ